MKSNETHQLFRELASVELSPNVKELHKLKLAALPSQRKKHLAKKPILLSMAIALVAMVFLASSLISSEDRNSTAFKTIEPYRTVIAQTNSDVSFQATLPTRPGVREILFDDRTWKSTLDSVLSRITEVPTPTNTLLLFDFAIYEEDSTVTRFKVYENEEGIFLKDLDTGNFYTTNHSSLSDLISMMENTY